MLGKVFRNPDRGLKRVEWPIKGDPVSQRKNRGWPLIMAVKCDTVLSECCFAGCNPVEKTKLMAYKYEYAFETMKALSKILTNKKRR